MSALDQALKHAMKSHSDKRSGDYVSLAPDEQEFEVPMLLSSGVGMDAMHEIIGSVYDIVRRTEEGANVVEAITSYVELFPRETRRAALTPSYVWLRSGIKVYLAESETEDWMLRDSREGDFYIGEGDKIEPPKTSDVTTVKELEALLSDDLQVTGKVCGFSSDNLEEVNAHLARKPLRVTSSGVILLPRDYVAGDVIPDCTAGFTMPNPYSSSSPRPDATALALIQEAKIAPTGYLLLTAARMIANAYAYADGAESNLLRIEDGHGIDGVDLNLF